MNINYKRSEFSTDERMTNCKLLQPLEIILLTSSKQKKYIVSLVQRKKTGQDNKSFYSETQKNNSTETSVNAEEYNFDKKFVPREHLFHKTTQISEKSFSSLESKRNKQKLRHHPTTNISRLSGGWGKENLICIKKRLKNKQKSKSSIQKWQNKYEKNTSTSEKQPNNSVSKQLIELDKNYPLKENAETENLPRANNKNDIQGTLDNEIKQIKDQNQANESSVVENFINKTCPSISSQSDLNKPIPAVSDDSEALDSKDKQPHAELLSDLVCVFPCNDEICKRIDTLEHQVSKINFELKNLQPIPNNLENFGGLSKHLSEINDLLVELRVNISKLQYIELKMQQTKETDNNEAREILSQQYDYMSNAMNFSEEAYEGRYLNSANCDIYGKSQIRFARSKCMESDENRSDLCNCINYSQKFSEHKPQIEQHMTNNRWRQHTEIKVNQAISERYIKPINSYLFMHKPFLNEEAHTAATGQNNCYKSNYKQWHSDSPATSITINNKPITPVDEDDKNSFSDDLANDGSVPEIVPSSSGELPLTTYNISKALRKIIGDIKTDEVVLTVYLESNNLYFINVSLLRTAQCLGYIYTNAIAFRKAKENKVFDKFLLFSVLDSESAWEERNQVLRNSFEFVNIEDIL